MTKNTSMSAASRSVCCSVATREALHGTPLHRPILCEEDAWAIAMAWREQLHAHVALQVDPLQDTFNIVENYEWIRFDVATSEQARIARAAATTWFWLSCCVGYSDHENPRFWKRVFCEWMRSNEKLPTQATAITDAIRFFDHPDHTFPCVQLCSDSFPTHTTFFNSSGSFPHDESPDPKLQGILLHLQPYMVASRLQRPIQVRVTGVWSPAQIVGLNTIPSPADPMEPNFVLDSVFIDSNDMPTINSQLALLCHPLVRLTSIGSMRYEYYVTQTETALQLRTLFQIDEPPPSNNTLLGRVTTFQASRTHATPVNIAAICSTLPHSQSIQTFRFTPSHPPRFCEQMLCPLSPMDWAWLGYALFHPDAQASKWCNLEIYLEDMTMEAVRALGLMALGNNLSLAHAENDITTPMASHYHTARVREGTRVRTESVDGEEHVYFLTLDIFTWVCLCVDDPSSLAEWVRVVTPGLGFGWILASSIVAIVSRAPSSSCVTSLRLDLAPTASIDPLVGLLTVVGLNLKRLDLGERKPFTATELRYLLTACPALTSLQVQHDGSVWAGPFADELPLSMEEVWLSAPYHFPSELALQTSMQNLSVLRISASSKSQSFQHSERNVAKLLQRHPRLQYVHWCGATTTITTQPRKQGTTPPVPYVDGRLHTHKQLRKLPIRALFGSFAPFSTECQVAFLSVVKNKANSNNNSDITPSSSPYGQIGTDLARQIFGFATSSVPRDLWIDGE